MGKCRLRGCISDTLNKVCFYDDNFFQGNSTRVIHKNATTCGFKLLFFMQAINMRALKFIVRR